MRLSLRSGERGDHANAMLMFFSIMTGSPDPGGVVPAIEVARVVTSVAHLRNIIDISCKMIDYYPEKSVGKEGGAM